LTEEISLKTISRYPPYLSPDRGVGDRELDAEIRRLIEWAGEQCDMGEFAKQIQVRWNRRFTATLGRATFDTCLIELSSKMWNIVDDFEHRQVVVHEACHLFTREKMRQRGLAGYYPEHGVVWHQLMALCGYPAAAIRFEYTLDRLPKYLVHCRCRDHFVSPQMMGRIRRGDEYRCKFCKSRIRTTPYGGEEEKEASDPRTKR
jgi:predicted SprT family Zn-dependent metalloprotease